MSGPFSPIGTIGTPPWSAVVPAAGNFAPVNVLGQGYDEVGYGEGGFGEDGYDTPSVAAQSAPLPNWTTGSLE